MNKIIGYVLKSLEYLLKNHEFKMRTGLAKGFKRRYGFGFKPNFSPTPEEKFLKKQNFEGKVAFDIGAYVGIHSIFFADVIGENGKVVAFEPNPRNYEELLYNVKLNSFENITCVNIGLGSKHEHTYLFLDFLYPSRGSIKEIKDRNHGEKEKIEIEVYPLDKLMKIKKLPVPDFIKIDVEGVELDVLLGMTETINKYKPFLLLEIHGKLTNEIVEYLLLKNYSIYHIESHENIKQQNNYTIQGGHLTFLRET